MLSCGHCGFDGPVELKGEVLVETNSQHIDGYGPVDWHRKWLLYRCPICHEPTLSGWWESELTDFGFEAPSRIYPSARNNDSLPTAVRLEYDKALKVKRIDPGLYAVVMGRLLEVVCKDKGKTDGTLDKRLKALANDGVIPEPLAKVAHQLRSLRNFGAHDASVEVVKADVPVIESFAEAILEYLYRAPAQMAALQASLDERKRAAKKPAES